MKIHIHAILIVITCAVWSASPAEADFHYFMQRQLLDWHRNNAWPQPFVHVDRLATCAPFVTMAQNGWIQQSTLSDFHFDPVSNELTEAGKLKVRHILTNHPEGFRTIYLVKAVSSEESSIRLDSVQQTVAKMTEQGPMPDVQFVAIDPPTKPAFEINAIGTKYQATLPDPRLPTFESTTQ
jgi:hypothetical protein